MQPGDLHGLLRGRSLQKRPITSRLRQRGRDLRRLQQGVGGLRSRRVRARLREMQRQQLLGRLLSGRFVRRWQPRRRLRQGRRKLPKVRVDPKMPGSELHLYPGEL